MLAASPGERLRTLRDLLGLTQEQLEKMSGVKQSWISQVETAARDATEDGLRAIAEATDTPLAFFSVQPSTVPLDSLRFRKRASASKVLTRRVHTFYAESYRVNEALLVSERYPTPPLPYATVDELTQDDIEDLAAQTRDALRLAPDKPIPHLTRVLERAGITVAPFILSDDPEEQPVAGGHYGVSYWGGVGEPALIGYFPGSQGDRERFTLAHEVGHLVLHTFRPRATDPEREADRFAGALLMPRVRAQENLSEKNTLREYARLKATWGVSMQALIQRGFALDLLSETRRRSLFVQLSSKGWRKQEPVPVGREAPLLLWTLLSRRFGPRPYRPAAESLAVPPTMLRSIAPTPDVPSRQADDASLETNVATIRRIGR
ncbi:helix-turn-helix domain-containing protein [Amycolatopsis cihanbeyliensis]|uniref:Zn-dependent peptidase ImmA (M78 family) n=1 Tax=Amycolatopsis cihanbeyliensis TaxID=1128664 RepID=A0A542DPR0_AMYCI|nr:XRE family transcriptional regulator [Amycolatopsis cihanbeyliensis]TQJ05098.1 Zn-dependent peptidase ImmA (M78 family) [Amycolatopsis cihanbeyliensis]